MIFKEGVVIFNLHPEVAWAIRDQGVVDQIFREEANRHGVITSIRDEGHAPNSYHYYGRAFDCRTNDLDFTTSRRCEQRMKEKLGDDWRVELENIGEPGEHIHAEFRGE